MIRTMTAVKTPEGPKDPPMVRDGFAFVRAVVVPSEDRRLLGRWIDPSKVMWIQEITEGKIPYLPDFMPKVGSAIIHVGEDHEHNMVVFDLYCDEDVKTILRRLFWADQMRRRDFKDTP